MYHVVVFRWATYTFGHQLSDAFYARWTCDEPDLDGRPRRGVSQRIVQNLVQGERDERSINLRLDRVGFHVEQLLENAEKQAENRRKKREDKPAKRLKDVVSDQSYG